MKEDHHQAVEEKDAALALLNGDLKYREHDNVALQAQRDVYKDQLQKYQDTIIHLMTRYVPHAKDPGKDNIVILLRKIPPLRRMSFMSIPTTLLGCNDGSLTQKTDGSKHRKKELEEKGYVERFQCHFRLVDILRDVLYALAMPSIQE